MDAHLTSTKINAFRKILANEFHAQTALDTLEKYGGRLDASFDALWSEKNGSPPNSDLENLRKATLKVLRNEICVS